MIGGRALAEIDDPAKAERTQMRDAQSDLAGNIAQRVAALIAVDRRVRQLTAADAVEDDQHYAWKRSQVRDVSIVAMACLNAM